MYDFELILKGKQRFKVHRAILAAGSDYFKTYFQNPSENNLEIKIDEIEAFPWMLKFLYTGTFPQSTVTFDQIESLMKLATTYQIPILLQTLINLMTEKIDGNNCLHLLFMEKYFQDQWVNIRKIAIERRGGRLERESAPSTRLIFSHRNFNLKCFRFVSSSISSILHTFVLSKLEVTVIDNNVYFTFDPN